MLLRRRANDWLLRERIATETGVPPTAIFNPDVEVGQPMEPQITVNDPNA